MQLFRTTSLESIQSDVSGDDDGGSGEAVGHLRKRLSARHLVSIGTLSAFVLVSIAVPVLRRTLLDLEVETWLRFLAWLVLGLLIYAVYGYRHSRLGNADRREAAVGTD